MSRPSITAYLPFRRVRVVDQEIWGDNEATLFRLIPDRRFTPICSGCGEKVGRIHSRYRRDVRDLNLASHRVVLDVEQRRLRCGRCGGTRSEDPEFVARSARVTKRMARYIAELCEVLSVAEVADHLGLDWKLVKRCDKAVLEKEFSGTDTTGLRMLAVDEIAIKKRHDYMTVVLDWETGRVVWLGEGRRAETLRDFFSLMKEEERAAIEAIAMDMWPAYMKAVREALPNARIVFDLFHVVQNYNRDVLDKVRIAAYRKIQDKEESRFIKGSRFLLYKNEENLTEKERPKLAELLKVNEEIQMAHVLKDSLKQIWAQPGPWATRKALKSWCALAHESGISALQAFARTLQSHARGIVSHGTYRIHTGRLEGVNNKIKVIKRKAYGFHDPDYFALKVKQAFPG